MINQPKLNLACGQIRIEGYFGIDLVKTENVDAQMNLELFPWDIASDSAEDVICNHFIEHLSFDYSLNDLLGIIDNASDFDEFKFMVSLWLKTLKEGTAPPTDGLIRFMTEVYRILKVGGKIHITCPHYNTGIAWQDPTHRRGITEQTFMYFDKGWRERSKLTHYPIHTDLQVALDGYELYPDMDNKSGDEKRFSFRHLSNVIANVKFTLTKKPI
jgi:predicted SAM-dependent methyltransferase